MAYEWDDDCLGCEVCRNCGRGRFKAYYCDKCGEETKELYVGDDGKELCWECYRDQFEERYCDIEDETVCSNCGRDEEILYKIEGEYYCEECMMNMAEKVDIGD